MKFKTKGQSNQSAIAVNKTAMSGSLRKSQETVLLPTLSANWLNKVESGDSESVNLTTDFILDYLRSSSTSPVTSATGLFLIGLLWNDNDQATIFGNPRLVSYFNSIKDVKDLGGIIEHLRPSDVQRFLKLIEKFKETKSVK